MSKEWDDDKGGRKEWINWLSSVFIEVKRVLKPGGHCLVWSIPRTSHWTGTALEDAGFEVRDVISHVYGSGFPKSLNIGKAVDKKLGNERKSLGYDDEYAKKNPNGKYGLGISGNDNTQIRSSVKEITKGTSEFEGQGTGLKPAHEKYWLVTKPIENQELYNIEKKINEICLYLLNVNVVEINLMLNQVEQKEVLDFVQLNVEQRYNILEDLLGVMDMSPSKKMISSFLNIATLWNNILVVLLSKENKFIISTKTKVITELKTLNYYLSENIQNYITKENNPNVGEQLNVKIVETNMNTYQHQIEESFVVINALLNTIKSTIIHTQENENETGTDNLFNSVKAEEWWLVRKPISEKTIVDNVLRWGTGGLNIDECRIDNSDMKEPKNANEIGEKIKHTNQDYGRMNVIQVHNNLGRFPSNFCHDGSDEVMAEFEKAGVSKSIKVEGGANRKSNTETINPSGWKEVNRTKKTEGHNDSGTPARFFYCSKPSTKERNMGCDELEEKGYELNRQQNSGTLEERYNLKSKNNHPTLKSVKLMAYLITLITPKNGIVLDPFMGSGTTGISALLLDHKFIGIEMNEEYIRIAETRIRNFEKYRQFLK